MPKALNRVHLLAALLCAAVLLGSGCDTARKTWRDTQKLYREYVNVDPHVDLSAQDYRDAEVALAPVMTPVDMRLAEMLRSLDARDSFPDDAWVNGFLKKYSWLSGLAATDMAGEVLLKKPEETLKPLEFKPLLEPGEAWRDRRMRAFIDNTPLGPELYVATPHFRDNKLQGLILAHFDPRSLAQLSPQAGKLLMVSPEAVLWAGDYGDLATRIQAEPWARILTGEGRGAFRVEGREFVWLARYVGDKQIVYLTELPREK